MTGIAFYIDMVFYNKWNKFVHADLCEILKSCRFSKGFATTIKKFLILPVNHHETMPEKKEEIIHY